MADSFIQLSPDSTGKRVDTRTAPDGDHREVQVIGSPTTAEVAEADLANGLDVDVTRLPALPAGTNNIGDVDILSLPNEGQQTMANSISVAIASDQSTVPVSLAAGGTTQYAEDTAHVSGDLVTLAGVVQQSADAALSSDGDRSILQVDASGFLKVNIKAGAGAGGTAMVDDAAFTPAVTNGTPSFAFADETAPDSVDEGDAGALRMTLDRKLLTRVVGATDANRLDVDGSGHAQVDIAATSVTVPVSAASLPLPTGASTAALQTQPGVDIGDVTVNNAAGASAVNVQDGGNSLTVDNAALSVVGGGVEATALRVTLASDSTGLVSVDDNGGSLTVDGTVAVSGVVDTELPAAAALADNTANPTVPAVGSFLMAFDGTNWDRVQTGAAATGSLKVDGSAVTQPVSAASLPLPTGASTLAEQQTQTTHLATIAGDTTDIEAAVELIDDTVATLGTSTYTEATTKGLIVGAIRRDADTTLVDTTNEVSPLQVDANGRLKVEAFSGETLPVSGTVAVTNADMAAAAASLAIMDDWDETDRAKVNPIAGQAGVQGASGTVNALTQRVVLATDVGLPAGSSNIGDVDVLTMPVTEVVGDVAADAAVPANPLSIGGRASTVVPTAVSADGDSVYNWLNRLGMQVVSAIPGLGLNADPHTLLSETAQYTTTQTSAVLVAGGASERIVITSAQIQAGGTTAGTLQVYFGTGAYARGTDEAIFDGEFAPSATLKPGIFMAPPGGFRAGALGDDILVTTSAAINPLTITVWYYVLGV